MDLMRITRRMDPLGRIVIPMQARKKLGWEENTPIVICAFGKHILLRAQADEEEGIGESAAWENPVMLEIKKELEKTNDANLLLVLQLLRQLAKQK